MNRNNQTRFSRVPANIDIQRSKFDRSYQYKTTFNAGKLIPFMVDEVLPGDTFSLDTSFVCRMGTPLFPVMDTCFLDFWYFFVPNRLVWEHWKELMGENNESAWVSDLQYEVPFVTFNKGYCDPGSTGDYFGLPVYTSDTEGSIDLSVNALPFRAYGLIWNEWFRDQNLQDPVLVNVGDVETGSESYFNELLSVNKRHDYFTSCLPAPQKGPSVLLPLGDLAPVNFTNDVRSFDEVGAAMFVPGSVGLASTEGYHPLSVDYNRASNSGGLYGDDQQGTVDFPVKYSIGNAYADLSAATASTINQLRQAFAVQRLFERDARSGSRYREFIKAHFGVTVPDSTVQVPEYLGGASVPINVSQVIQTSQTSDVSPQGNAGAYSKTVMQRQGSFTKSFSEHGLLIGVMAVRALHSYQNNVNKLWSRRNRLDYYLPVLANIGEQPVLNKEIWWDPEDVFIGDDVFGYQEAWAEYRYKPSTVTGYMRSSVEGSLDAWHYADDYTSANEPYLSNGWIQEPASNIDRTLAVSSDLSHQFIIDMWFDLICTRPMPLYSVPGLIDHH